VKLVGEYLIQSMKVIAGKMILMMTLRLTMVIHRKMAPLVVAPRVVEKTKRRSLDIMTL